MATLSNHIKALLVTEDISEVARVAQDKCLTLQHFDYKCQRSRDDEGKPYGSTISVTLNCTMRSTDGMRVFYDRIKSIATHNFTFVFNATFDDQRFLADYEDAMIVSGYVTDIEEDFDSSTDGLETGEQMLIHVKILLSRITYVGRISNKILPIINAR